MHRRPTEGCVPSRWKTRPWTACRPDDAPRTAWFPRPASVRASGAPGRRLAVHVPPMCLESRPRDQAAAPKNQPDREHGRRREERDLERPPDQECHGGARLIGRVHAAMLEDEPKPPGALHQEKRRQQCIEEERQGPRRASPTGQEDRSKAPHGRDARGGELAPTRPMTQAVSRGPPARRHRRRTDRRWTPWFPTLPRGCRGLQVQRRHRHRHRRALAA